MALEEFKHFFQEASHKTKVDRDKNKIRNDLGIEKNNHSEYGIITDKASGNERYVKLTFDTNKPTAVGGIQRDYNKQIFYVVMNINPNDLNRGHGFTKYLHEKNHVLQDLRKTISKTDNGKSINKIVYTHKNDISDQDMIRAFISKHSNEIISDHSKDPDEYMADLNTARKRGFNETIHTLEDLLSTANSPSSKHVLNVMKRTSKLNTNKRYDDAEINILRKEYTKILHDYEFDLKTMESDVYTNQSDIQFTRKMIKVIKKQLSSDDNFKNAVISTEITNEFNNLCRQHDSDILLRIQFLRDMKRLNNMNKIFSEGQIIEYIDNGYTLKHLVSNHNFKIYQESCNNLSIVYNIIKDNLSNIFNEYNISDNIIYESMNYVIIDSLETEGDE